MYKSKKIYFPYPLTKTLLLVGMPGAGKTSLGKRLANIFNIPFTDSDTEIEIAAGGSCGDIFKLFGEEEFRRGEEKIMARLLNGPICVLSSGGGSFLSENTRKLAKEKAVSIFVDASINTIIRNTSGRTHRPMLNTDRPDLVIKDLMGKRRPFYEQADITIPYDNEAMGQVLRRIVSRINEYARN
ncbi:MAG: shikimate kinase [Alphaproteobacteria bacterium]|nr:shikimate kinase [Alphaproteobacteria bacterium]